MHKSSIILIKLNAIKFQKSWKSESSFREIPNSLIYYIPCSQSNLPGPLPSPLSNGSKGKASGLSLPPSTTFLPSSRLQHPDSEAIQSRIYWNYKWTLISTPLLFNYTHFIPRLTCPQVLAPRLTMVHVGIGHLPGARPSPPSPPPRHSMITLCQGSHIYLINFPTHSQPGHGTTAIRQQCFGWEGRPPPRGWWVARNLAWWACALLSLLFERGQTPKITSFRKSLTFNQSTRFNSTRGSTSFPLGLFHWRKGLFSLVGEREGGREFVVPRCC